MIFSFEQNSSKYFIIYIAVNTYCRHMLVSKQIMYTQYMQIRYRSKYNTSLNHAYSALDKLKTIHRLIHATIENGNPSID